MNTEDLYFGSIRKVISTPEKSSNDKIEDFAPIQDYTFLKEKNGKYKDIRSILGKYYQTSYQTIGDNFVDLNHLIPYSALDIIKKNRTKQNKSRKELLRELEQIKKELLEEYDTSKFFIGYLSQIIETRCTLGKGNNLGEKYLNGVTTCRFKRIKKTIFLKTDYYEFIDLITGKIYSDLDYIEGNVFVDTSSQLIPLNFYLPPQERCNNITKRKALSYFNKINNQTR